MFTFPTREDAEMRRDYLNRHAPRNVRYVVELFPDDIKPRERWLPGVRREHMYIDKPELGWISSGFVGHCRF